jgi:hypothetical protein
MMPKYFTICVMFMGLAMMTAEGYTENKPLAEMTEAAQNFLKSLPQELLQKTAYEVSNEERTNWHFVPKERNGVRMGDLSSDQKLLAFAFLNTALSNRGVWKAVTIMYLDKILFDLEKHPRRNHENYWITFFGEPSLENTWGWRIEGHHISINFTVADGQVVSTTPLFLGANPAQVRHGELEGLQVLEAEEKLARKLMSQFNEEQKKQVIFSDEAPSDILTGARVRVSPLEQQGLPVSEMTGEQKQTLHALLEEYVYRVRPEFAEEDIKKAKEAGMENIYFGWAGGTKEGEGHYYRIQGPTFLLEYDNTQNNANHVHTVWRDFDGDWGTDVLAEHYKEHHQESGK